MATRIIVGLSVILAIIQGLAPDLVPNNILPVVLVILGVAYGVMALDAEDATAFLVFAIAVGLAASTNVLGNLQFEGGIGLGGKLDAIVDQISVVLYSAVIAVLAIRTWNRIMPGDSD